MKFSSSGVLIALIVATASAIGSLWLRSCFGEKAVLSIIPVSQVFITFWTGGWLWYRMRYTDFRGSPQPGIYSILFSSAISFCN